MSAKNSKFFEYLLKIVPKYFDAKKYQSIGASMLQKEFPNPEKLTKEFPATLILDRFSYLPYTSNEIKEIFNSPVNKTKINPIGIHWFNGSPIAKNYIDEFENANDKKTFSGMLFQYVLPFYNDFINLLNKNI